jgi:hypothetical protein
LILLKRQPSALNYSSESGKQKKESIFELKLNLSLPEFAKYLNTKRPMINNVLLRGEWGFAVEIRQAIRIGFTCIIKGKNCQFFVI